MPPLLKSFLEFCLLTSISTEPMYPKEIHDRLQYAGIEISDGTLYPILNRLKKTKLLEVKLEESDSGAPRKYYYLTSKGTERLDLLNSEWRQLTKTVHKLRRKPYLDR